MCMEQKAESTITVRDRLLRAWEDAMAQVKAFELWSSGVEMMRSPPYSPNTQRTVYTPRACWALQEEK